MTDREAMQMALDALEFDSYYGTGKKEAIDALRAALAKGEQEPVACCECRRKTKAVVETEREL